MKIKPLIIVVISIMSLGSVTSCQKSETGEQPKEISEVTDEANSVLSLDLVQLLAQGKMPPKEEVLINFDHFFKSSKVYQAYPLKALLEPYLKQLELDVTSDASLTFFCTDGYQPTQKLREVLLAEGFLAFQDVSVLDSNLPWPDSLQAKFSPFYLVWKNMPYENRKLNWSYGLYQIDIHQKDNIYDPIYPKDTAAIVGFEYFQQYCIKCHSINRIGGNIGPEFNDPKNITSYWNVEDMWAYAKNPQSFRFNARMHPMEPLIRTEFDEIIIYLKYISQVKPEVHEGN